jgi:cephalosporin-C deacetylase
MFPISADPQWHVLHNIDKRDQYILKGCVEDIWIAVSCMELLFPYLQGKLGFLGLSFTGGIGALAMACEDRIARAHFNVPTFGHHRLRLRQPTMGSGRALQSFFRKAPKLILSTLRYYDAANAAEAITMPVHFALALKDSVVTPAGQFAIYNHTNSNKQLFILDEGHADYARQDEQKKQLLAELDRFFAGL